MSIKEEISAAPMVPLRHLVSFNPRPKSISGDDAVYLPMEAISEFGPADTSRRRPINDLRQGYSYIANGDVALAKVTPCFENGKGLVARDLPDGQAFATTEVTVIRPSNHIDAEYLSWILQSSRFLRHGASHMTGSGGLRRVPDSFIGSYSIPLLNRRRQRSIASFLDRETARIDTLIEEQQKLIEMLHERRQAVVDASFSSLGEPKVQLRRYITFLTSGSRGWGDYYADQGERFLRIGNLPRSNLTIRGGIQYVDLPADVTEGSRTLLREGDLLFSITAYLGSVAVVEDDWAGAYVSQHVALCRLEHDQVASRYIGWFMLTTAGQDQLNEGAAGGTKMQLALDDIRGLRVPTAPIDQQRRIAAHLDEQTALIDLLIMETEQLIKFARERRSALITAAVTGQIDVREMV